MRAEPLTDQAIIDTVRGSKPDAAEIESDDDDNIPVPEAPTHTEALAMCDHLLTYLETRSHSDYYFPYVNWLPFTSSSIMNNIMLNNKLRSLIFSCNISVVCNKLYVVLNNESENKMKAIKLFLEYCDKLTLLSLICDTHEMNIQGQTRLYRTSYISKYLLRSLGLRYIWVLLYMHWIHTHWFKGISRVIWHN